MSGGLVSEQPRQEFDLRYPFRTQPDGGPCWCMSADEPHEGWVHSPLCNEMFRRWWAGRSDQELVQAAGTVLDELDIIRRRFRRGHLLPLVVHVDTHEALRTALGRSTEL